jgi:hypothetical protein
MLMNRFDLYRALRNELSKHSALYRILASRRGAEHLRPNTDLVIEGYPRSANSFLEAYIKVLSEDKLQLSHHSHSRSVVLRAVKIRKPVLVLVRHPVEAAVSYFEESGKLSSPWVLLREYVIFYKQLEHWADRVLFCSFETATRKPEVIIPAVNAKFGTDFSLRTQTPEDGQKINELMISVADQRARIVPAYLVERSTEETLCRDKLRNDVRRQILDRRYEGIRRNAEFCYETINRMAL